MAYKLSVVSKAAILPRTVWGDTIRDVNDKLRTLEAGQSLELRFDTAEEAQTACMALRKQLCFNGNGKPTNTACKLRGQTIFIYTMS